MYPPEGEEKAIFLNNELRIDRVKQMIEIKYYVKPSNQNFFLNYTYLGQ